MIRTVTLRLHPNSPPLDVQMDTLVAEIVQGDLLCAESASVLDGDRWRPLRELTDAPWQEAMLQAVDRFIRAGQAEEAEQMAHRVLQYCHSESCPEARRAAFFLGVLRANAAEWSAAAELFRRAVGGDSCCRAAAHNNLAVAFTLLRDPVASVEHVLAAQADPRMPTAVLTQRNLARAMLREQAADIPGRPTWKELQARADEKLKRLDPGELRKAADPARPFPSFHVLLVLHADQCPADIAASLAAPQSGAAAARLLSDRAAEALRRGSYHLAIRLAEGAQRSHPGAVEQVTPIRTSAQLKLDERRRLHVAENYADCVSEFLGQLEQLTLDRIDAPHESLALLRPYFKNPGCMENLYRERVSEIIWIALRESHDDERRQRLLEMLAHYVPAEQATACREASRHCRSQKALHHFRGAVLNGDWRLAEAALRQADASSGEAPTDAHEILCGLRRESSFDEPAAAFEMLSAALHAVAAGNFDAAAAGLHSLLPAAAIDEVVGLKLCLEAAQHLACARDRLRAEDWSAARTSLRQVLHREPQNQTALVLQLSLDVMTADLPGNTIRDAARDGADAIRAFMNDNELRCRQLCAKLERSLPPDGLLAHLSRKPLPT